MSLVSDPFLDVFRDVMRDDQLQVTDSSTFEDIPAWDSVAQINLILAIEERFGVTFTVTEAVELNSVGAIRQALASKLS